MLDNVQIIKDKEEAKFVVIPFEEYQELKELLASPEKLADYLDYLHMKQIKLEDEARLTLEQVKAELSLE